MKHVVITGGTRGIGHGLAQAFLERGCRVTISGRSQTSVETALNQFTQRYPAERILGYPCDVCDATQVQALWDYAHQQGGVIDYWINNAGISHRQQSLWEHSQATVDAVVGTNLLGVIYGAQVALRGMLKQGTGTLYLMEGLGSDGSVVKGMQLYGTTKYAVRYLTKALVKETKRTPIRVGALSPGMVVTDLLIKDYADRPEAWKRAKAIFNILADTVETVAPWLAEQILKNSTHGARIAWLTKPKIFWRFLRAPWNRRSLFDQPSIQG